MGKPAVVSPVQALQRAVVTADTFQHSRECRLLFISAGGPDPEGVIMFTTFFFGVVSMQTFLFYGKARHPIPPGDLLRIGSDPACDIHVANDIYVSRRHCSVSLVNGQLTVVDLGSTHGTFVNGMPLFQDPTDLNDGDVIQIGQTVLNVSFQDCEDNSGIVQKDHLFR